MNPYKIRSILFIPGIETKFFQKVLTLKGKSKPNGLLFDLEDSIHPNYKQKARDNLSALFKNTKYGEQIRKNYFIGIRTNALSSKWFEDDAKLIRNIQPHYVMIPKVEDPSQISFARKKTGVDQIFVIIETLKGLYRKEEILRSMKDTDILGLGYEDLAADLLIERPSLHTLNPMSFIILDCLIAARRNNVVMLDAISRYFKEEDLEKFKQECVLTASWGLSGKSCMHPNQIAITNEIYGNRMQELLSYGDSILHQFESLKGGSFVIVNKKKEMMDTPSFRMYERLFQLMGRK